MIQDYISQVSEEIEGRVTKKVSKEFSRTESRFLGALSKLDVFLLNPQVRTCSVAVPGTSRNNNSQNRETTGDRPSDDPCPEVGYSSHHSGRMNSPEAENYPHSIDLQESYKFCIILQISCKKYVLERILEDSCKKCIFAQLRKEQIATRKSRRTFQLVEKL